MKKKEVHSTCLLDLKDKNTNTEISCKITKTEEPEWEQSFSEPLQILNIYKNISYWQLQGKNITIVIS